MKIPGKPDYIRSNEVTVITKRNYKVQNEKKLLNMRISLLKQTVMDINIEGHKYNLLSLSKLIS